MCMSLVRPTEISWVFLYLHRQDFIHEISFTDMRSLMCGLPNANLTDIVDNIKSMSLVYAVKDAEKKVYLVFFVDQ